MVLDNIHRWLEHFEMAELDSIISTLIKIKKSEADTRPTMMFGKLTEADYYRLKLHYRIELFAGNEERNQTLNDLMLINNDLYNRLHPIAEHGAGIIMRNKHIEEITK